MKRNFGLDVLRSISIWMVLLQHLGFHVPGLAPLRLGGLGVEIFFVLSGFLIGGILFKEINKGNNLVTTLKNFWIRRWFRIIPLYYAVLIFKLTFIDHSIGTNIFYYFLFLQNNFYGIEFLGVSWSLVIEEWFYLFSPLFLFFVIRGFKNHKKIVSAIVCFIVLVVALRAFYVYQTNAPFVGINGNFPFRFDSLFLGVLMAYIKINFSAVFKRFSSPAIFLLMVGVFFIYLYSFIVFSAGIDEGYFFRIGGFFILPLIISICVPYVSSYESINQNNIITKSAYRVFTSTSVLTYSIYLTHPFVNEFLAGHLHTDKYSTAALAILLTYAISWFVYTFFEHPILNLRDRISK